ncbi:MAG: Proteinase inhibitor I2 [Candidatus Woesebacteria bacterium GW2011_GWA1_37_7]|uniref:Proteinase inhibitor I2 n=1 Tax=Candidatus Woesebacteria bacterium GW2011_GWA1_37_7 TaxID=1618545 RepID=A0A0G0JK87_9BACT|nr:MAG: Proteinase inhibitor I2 [Candidatus Woesebacteria bacterium GW2011_GWA1_37_7]
MRQHFILILGIAVVALGLVGFSIYKNSQTKYFSEKPSIITPTPSTSTVNSPPMLIKDSRCYMNPDVGPCKALFKRYYYDINDSKCKEFTWGGCNGVVPFETIEECQTLCEFDETTYWKTYTNTNIGFSFKYPRNSEFKEGDTGGKIIASLLLKSGSGQSSFGLLVSNGSMENHTAADREGYVLLKDRVKNLETKHIIIDDTTAKVWYAPKDNIYRGDIPFRDIILERNGNTYYFFDYYTNNGDFLDKILSTFKFLDNESDEEEIK